MSQSIQHILSTDTPRLAAALALENSTARIEVQCLLQKVLQVQRAYLLAHPERVLSAAEYSHYQQLLQRRLSGEPIAYILGEREFFGLDLKVTPATLIPRPDTELLVELALKHLLSASHSATLSPNPSPAGGRGWPSGRERVGKLQILDLGTGSGAIALAIAKSCPQAEVLACDASIAALTVARENACALSINNVSFIHSDWFAAIGSEKFFIIVSNPPYIADNDPHLAQGDVCFEPSSALQSGVDGLDDIRRIISQAPAHLLPGGRLLLEHGYDQATAVRGLLESAGFAEVFSVRDLGGIERVSAGRMRV